MNDATVSGLSYALHTAGEPGLNKASVLVTGEREALLIDGQFTLAEQHRVLASIIDSGRRLTTVFVSAADPDCYFGLQAIRQAFPDVRVLATPATVEKIRSSWQAKLDAWQSLGPLLATEVIIPEVLEARSLELEGHALEVRGGDPGLVWRTEYLWQPEDRALLGGVMIFAGLHVWTADTTTSAERAVWDATLAEAQKLAPSFVVPGHRTPDSPTDASAIAFTRDYLAAFEEELARAGGSDALKAAMLKRYPGLDGLLSLDLGARVNTGEMPWA